MRSWDIYASAEVSMTEEDRPLLDYVGEVALIYFRVWIYKGVLQFMSGRLAMSLP
jgi:hypothetical protein